MFDDFHQLAVEVVVRAQDEARTLGHKCIGTEHILLGLLRVEEGLAARVLASFGITFELARARVVELIKAGDVVTPGRQLPMTSRANNVVENLALHQARIYGRDKIWTEDILLALPVDSVAARILLDFGVTLEMVRNEVIRQLGSAA